MKGVLSMGEPSAGWSLSESYRKVGVRPVLGGGAMLIGMPYCCANVPKSGCRFKCWVMLLIQVTLFTLTGRLEMSVLKMLLAGNSVQLGPGSGCAEALK